MSFFNFLRAPDINCLRNRGDIDGLLKIFNSQQDISLRKNAAEAIGYLQAPLAVDSLIAELSNSDDSFRSSVILALDRIGEKKAIAPVGHALTNNFQFFENFTLKPEKFGDILLESLILVLKNDEFYFRMGAARALGKMKNPQAIEPLIPVLDDDTDYVREAAARALDRLGWKSYHEIMKKEFDDFLNSLNDSDIDIGRKAAENLLKFGDDGLRVLKDGIEDEKSNAFIHSSWVFAYKLNGDDLQKFRKKYGGKKTGEILREINQIYSNQIEKSPDYLDRATIAVLNALRSIGDPSVIPSLETLAKKLKDRLNKTGVSTIHVATIDYAGSYSSDYELAEVESIIKILQNREIN
jgi:bilin biosynthesis protein